MDITPNLNLLSPVEADLMRNWTELHKHNMRVLDNVSGFAGPFVYAPTFKARESTAQINLGVDSLIEGYWFKLYDMVYVWGRVLWAGTGIDQGSGSNFYRFSLPVPSKDIPTNTTAGSGTSIGLAHTRDHNNTGNATAGVPVLVTNTEVEFVSDNGTSARLWSSGSPHNWEDNDRFTWFGSYPGDFS